MRSPSPSLAWWPEAWYLWPSYRRRACVFDALTPHVGVDEDHGHVPITGEDRTCAMFCATGFSQCHGQRFPIGSGSANHQVRAGVGQLFPDPGHPVNTGRQEPGHVRGPPDIDGSLVICRKPNHDHDPHVHILMVSLQIERRSLLARQL